MFIEAWDVVDGAKTTRARGNTNTTNKRTPSAALGAGVGAISPRGSLSSPLSSASSSASPTSSDTTTGEAMDDEICKQCHAIMILVDPRREQTVEYAASILQSLPDQSAMGVVVVINFKDSGSGKKEKQAAAGSEAKGECDASASPYAAAVVAQSTQQVCQRSCFLCCCCFAFCIN